MPLLNVAALTELRPPQGEQRFVVGAVRRMAIHAVLAYRRMLPEEWTPLVLVAGVALIVDGVGADQFLGLGSVRIVADGALQLKRAAFVLKQVPRALERRFAYVCVTSKTGLGFRLVSQ